MIVVHFYDSQKVIPSPELHCQIYVILLKNSVELEEGRQKDIYRDDFVWREVVQTQKASTFWVRSNIGDFFFCSSIQCHHFVSYTGKRWILIKKSYKGIGSRMCPYTAVNLSRADLIDWRLWELLVWGNPLCQLSTQPHIYAIYALASYTVFLVKLQDCVSLYISKNVLKIFCSLTAVIAEKCILLLAWGLTQSLAILSIKKEEEERG